MTSNNILYLSILNQISAWTVHFQNHTDSLLLDFSYVSITLARLFVLSMNFISKHAPTTLNQTKQPSGGGNRE